MEWVDHHDHCPLEQRLIHYLRFLSPPVQHPLRRRTTTMAGLALATRLSECGKYTVWVLEAGRSGLGVPIIDIPRDYGLDVGTKYDCACEQA